MKTFAIAFALVLSVSGSAFAAGDTCSGKTCMDVPGTVNSSDSQSNDTHGIIDQVVPSGEPTDSN